MKRVTMYTDGSCLGNPGPGGWAALLVYEGRAGRAERQISGGYALTTNNRMEIMAVIKALGTLKEPCTADIYTDSAYVANAIRHNWINNWMRNNWQTSAKKSVKNQDLWKIMAELLKRHKVCFHWIEGHAGHKENELCDSLARSEAAKENLPPDEGMNP